MIHSLVGQTEVMTLSGVYMYMNQHTTMGSFLIAAGIICAGIRYSANIGLLSRYAGSGDLNDDAKSKLIKENKS